VESSVPRLTRDAGAASHEFRSHGAAVPRAERHARARALRPPGHRLARELCNDMDSLRAQDPLPHAGPTRALTLARAAAASAAGTPLAGSKLGPHKENLPRRTQDMHRASCFGRAARLERRPDRTFHWYDGLVLLSCVACCVTEEYHNCRCPCSTCPLPGDVLMSVTRTWRVRPARHVVQRPGHASCGR
jgi:hypothetical protein